MNRQPLFKMTIKRLLCCFIILTWVFINAFHCVGISTHLRVAVCTEYPPYQFLNEKCQPQGLHIDLMNEIAADSRLKIEYILMSTDIQCLEALSRHEVDAVLGVLPEKLGHFQGQLTDELSAGNLSIFVKESVARELHQEGRFNSLTAVTQYGVGSTFMLTNLKVQQRLAVGNPVRIFNTHREGLAELMVGDRSSLQYQIVQAGLEEEYTVYSHYVGAVCYHILVPEEDTILLRTLNQGLARIRTSGLYDELSDKWIWNPDAYQARITLRNIAVVGFFILLAALVYMISEQRTRRALKNEVLEKTCALQYSNAQLERQVRRIESESALRELLIQNSPSGLLLFEENGRIILMNHSAMLIAGISSLPTDGVIAGLPVFREVIAQEGHRLARGEKAVHNANLTLRGPEGDTRVFRCSFNRVAGDAVHERVLLSVDDITSEEAHKRLLFQNEKNQALSLMVAGIAHEIRNPLTAIRTFAWMSRNRREDPRFLEAFGEFVPAEVDRINKLVEGLINYAKPTKGGQRFIDLKPLVEECLYLVEAAAATSDILVHTEDLVEVSVYVNPDQMKQVVINVLMNSVDSIKERLKNGTPPPLSITVSTGKIGEKLTHLVIQDEGNGMSDDVLARCTDPFFTTKEKGTGLGLALCKQYLQENGGDLEIVSLPGNGTHVVMSIPTGKLSELEQQAVLPTPWGK